jgi:NAD(P)H-flavin reductase
MLLIAGGLGLAPLKPVIEQYLIDHTTQPSLTLVYGMRNPGQLLFQEEIKRWMAAGINIYRTVDRADQDWHEHIGVVTNLLEASMLSGGDTQVLICGPETMMKFTAEKLIELGQHPEQIYLSMERNMKCALGFCGHCQYAEDFVCRRGPIYSYALLSAFLRIKEL